MIHVFKHATDGINAAISTGNEINGQVAIPSIQNVKAVARKPRVMRAQIRARAVREWAMAVATSDDILLDDFTVLRTVEHG